MALGKLFKKWLGSEPPSEWADASDADLARLWSARAALSAPMVLKLRDEHVRRHLPFPLADPIGPMAPRLPGLDETLKREGLLSYLRRLDAYDREAEAFDVFDRGAWFAYDDDAVVAVILPTWRRETALAPAEDVSAAIIVAPQRAGAATAADVKQAYGLSGDAVHTLSPGDELTLGRLQLRAAGGVVEIVDDESDLRFLLGSSVPLGALVSRVDDPEQAAPLPDAVIGGISAEVTDAEREALEAAELGASELVHFDRFVLLPAVANTSGMVSVALMEPLFAPCGAAGRGVPVGPAAQRLLAGEASDEADGWDQAFTHLVAEDALEDAQHLVERAPAAVQGWLRGCLAEVRGDLEGARAAWQAAGDPRGLEALAVLQAREGEAPAAWEALQGIEASPHPLGAANRVIVAAMAGEHDAALALLMEEQASTDPWAHALLDTALHSADGATPAPLNPAGLRLAPISSALLYLRAGDLEEGERLLHRCLALEPRHPAALGELARHLLRTGRPHEVITLCGPALEAMPAFAHLRALRGLALLATGDAEQAASDFGTAARQVPDALDWRINQFEALARAGQAAQALERVEEVRGAADGTLVELLRRTLSERR